MQKQTFKLPKHLALGFAALMIAIMPEANAAPAVGSWGFGVQANGTFTGRFGSLKAKALDSKNNHGNKVFINALALLAGKEIEKDELELDLENVNFGNSLAIGVAFSGIYQVNDMFGIGGIAEIGISFHKEQWKALKSLTLSEGFFAKIGVAMTITEWFMISAGIRMSYLTADLTFSDEDTSAITDRTVDLIKKAHSSSQPHPQLNNLVKALGGSDTDTRRLLMSLMSFRDDLLHSDQARQDSAKKDVKTWLDNNKVFAMGSSSTWAFSFFLDGKVFIPLMGDNLKAVITVGFYTDIFAPNFSAFSGFGNKDVGIELHGRTGFQAGIGLAYMF